MKISGTVVFMRLFDKLAQLRFAGALSVYIDQLHFSDRRLWTVHVRVQTCVRVSMCVLSTDGLMTLERVNCEEVIHPGEIEEQPELCGCRQLWQTLQRLKLRKF